MEFDEVIKNRRCVRRFDSKKEVTDKQIKEILKAGTLAPSEGNVQPWHFVVVKNDGIKLRLTEAALGQSFIMQAFAVIVVCIDLDLAHSKYAERGIELYSKQSTAAACENMFLKATEQGLGACWVGAFDEKEIKRILKLEEKFQPVIIMPIGYPAESPTLPERKSVDEVTEWKD